MLLDLPCRGRWMARHSPASRIPSHGTWAFGSSHAIDLVGIGPDGLPAPRTWRTALTTEDPEIFAGFGREILAPIDAVVVEIHDGEVDHAARRSQFALVPYMLRQGERVRTGAAAIAGNHVVLKAEGRYVLLAHLQRNSIVVAPGQRVSTGEALGQCGNSGNSTQPHVHLQVSDSMDWATANGIAFRFRRDGSHHDNQGWMPKESEIFDARLIHHGR